MLHPSRTRTPADAPWRRRGRHPVVHTTPGIGLVQGRPVVASLREPLDTSAAPTVVWCHGLGGDHLEYGELLDRWASHGLRVIAPRFADSVAELAVTEPTLGVDVQDRSTGWMTDPAQQAAVLGLLFDPTHWRDRLRRVSLARSAGGGPAVLAGHSYGAFTAQLGAGTRLDGHDDLPPVGPLAGAVLLSPQGSGDRGLHRGSWADLRVPLLTVTGTDDAGPRGEGVAWRREPHDHAAATVRHLGILQGGDHALGGIHRPGEPGIFADDPTARAAVLDITTAFLLATLAEDEAAAGWLADTTVHGPMVLEHHLDGG